MRKRLFVPVIAATMAMSAAAQEPVDEDEAFDEALKGYGYSGGVAWQCAAEGDRTAHTDTVMTVFNRLAQLFGTDRAFFFAAAFGAGTVDAIDPASCGQHVAAFAAGLSAGVPAEGSK